MGKHLAEEPHDLAQLLGAQRAGDLRAHLVRILFSGEIVLAETTSRRWVEYRDGYVWLSWRGAHWLDHIERERRAVLLFIDPGDMYRVAHVETRLVRTAATTPTSTSTVSPTATGASPTSHRDRRSGS